MKGEDRLSGQRHAVWGPQAAVWCVPPTEEAQVWEETAREGGAGTGQWEVFERSQVQEICTGEQPLWLNQVEWKMG